MVVAAAVMQALAWAARGFAGSLYDGPNGMELAIFNDLCFCSLRSESGPPCLSSAQHTGHPTMNNPCQMSAYFGSGCILKPLSLLRHSLALFYDLATHIVGCLSQAPPFIAPAVMTCTRN